MGGRTVAVRLGREAHGIERRGPPLRGAHADGGVALHQLDVVEAVGHGVEHVLDRLVLVQVDEVLALGMREDRPGMVDRCALRLRLRRRLARLEAGRPGGLPAGMAPLRQAGLQVVRAVDRAGDERALRHALDGERRPLLVVDDPPAGVAQQLRQRRIADAHRQQVAGHAFALSRQAPLADDAIEDAAAEVQPAAPRPCLGHRVPGEHAQAALGRRLRLRRRRRLVAQIRHRRDLDARLRQVEGDAVAMGVGGGDHRALAGLDAVEADQTLHGRAQHHPRQVVAAEHHRLLEGAGRQHDLLGAQLDQTVAAHHGEPLVGEPAGAARLVQQRDVAPLGERPAQPLRLLGAPAGLGPEAGVVEGAAGARLIVDQQHLAAGLGGLQGGRQPGRAGADHRHVGEHVGLVVVAVRRPAVDDAEAGLRPDEPLPELPGPARLVERLVVEAHRHEAAELPEPGAAVAVEPAEDVERRDLHARDNGPAVGEHVGLVAHLDERVGVLAAGGEHAARTVVLERARQHANAIGGERAGDGVAGIADVVAAFETERYGPVAVNQRPRRRGQAARPHGVVLPPPSPAGAVKSRRSLNSSLAG